MRVTLEFDMPGNWISSVVSLNSIWDALYQSNECVDPEIELKDFMEGLLGVLEMVDVSAVSPKAHEELWDIWASTSEKTAESLLPYFHLIGNAIVNASKEKENAS